MADPQDSRDPDARCCSDENRLRVWKIDYVSFLNEVIGDSGRTPAELLAEGLPHIWRDRYVQMVLRETNIVRFTCGAFEYIYDDYASLEAAGVVADSPIIEARLVAVSGLSSPQKRTRDDYRLRGWVGATERAFGRGWDKGHYIAHSIGGAVDRAEANVFVQRRDLNRGWSEEGKRYREMENYCEVNPGTFCFSRPIYFDQSAKPAFAEFGLVESGGKLWVECFDNRPSESERTRSGSTE